MMTTSALHREVAKFKDWASAYPPHERSGEWECDYSEWTALYESFRTYLDVHAPDSATKNEISDLIYAVARDNEMEELVSEVAKSQEWLHFLLPHVLASSEQNAKWQFAVALGQNVLPFADSEHALLVLVADSDEYVSRMALQALGRIRSSHTESLCELAWQSGHEYQRIMALWVLKDIGSKKLHDYLARAKEDGREHVLSNAHQLKSA